MAALPALPFSYKRQETGSFNIALYPFALLPVIVT